MGIKFNLKKSRIKYVFLFFYFITFISNHKQLVKPMSIETNTEIIHLYLQQTGACNKIKTTEVDLI